MFGWLSYFSQRWRHPKTLIILFIIELGGTVAALALFGIADPDLYRTKMWQIGYDNGFNSNPNQILYAYANYEPIPKTPFVWSQTLTSFNLAISVLATFILLVKATMFVLHVWYPFLGFVSNTLITILWIVSIVGQAGPDHSDPQFPSSSAWYITKSCSYAAPSHNEGYCMQAKASFAVTVFMAFIFLTNAALGLWSMLPSAEERATQKLEQDDMQDMPMDRGMTDKTWKMKAMPTTSATPYTPRTLAFQTLDRQLPLRAQNGRYA